MPSQTAYKKKRQDAFRAAGRSMRLSRLDRSRRGTTDQRQLASVLRSHRAANPYQITPSAGRTVSFWRKTQISIPINQANGFANTFPNINWGFSLGRIIGFLGATFTYSLPVSSAAELQALFDYYMIRAVKLQMFFTKTNADFSAGASVGMPMLLICNDFDDIGESMSLNSMNERVGVRHCQFDASNTNGINHYIKPKPTAVMVQTNVDTGVLSTSNSGIVFGTQWLDTAQSNIVHNGVKIYYDNQGRATATEIGSITFVFDVEYVCKGYR